ncbi:hypothetical protein LDENG_00000740 [Lucifuga dentata]|nr:hypothetical protein LDENG_00000740 [Lucifuga dentata]
MKMEPELGGIFLENSTYNYDNYEYEDECKSERSEVLLIPVLYSVAVVVGVLGNGLLLGILALKRRSWSVTDTFILHMGVADNLLLVTLPFWAAYVAQDTWSFGTVFCKLSGALFNISFYSGIFLLVSISLDYYLSIVHTFQMYSRGNPRLAHISCLFVWLASLLLTIPDWIFLRARQDKAQEKMVCDHDSYRPDSQSVFDWQLASRLLYHTVGFLLPLAVLIFCYSCILLRQQRTSLSLHKQRSVRVILVLVMAFFLCWMPYNISLMVDTFQSSSKAPHEPHDDFCGNHRESLKMALRVTSALGCFHACLRPLLYLGLCRNFRKYTLEVLRSLKGAPPESRSSLWELGVGEDVLPAQAHEKLMLNQINTVEHQVQSSQS